MVFVRILRKGTTTSRDAREVPPDARDNPTTLLVKPSAEATENANRPAASSPASPLHTAFRPPFLRTDLRISTSQYRTNNAHEPDTMLD